MDDVAETQQKGDLAPPWKPGQSGNPAGRPKGLRPKLNEKFLAAMLEAFEAGGKRAIVTCMEADPATFLRALVALQPKDIRVTEQPGDEFTDEQLERIAAYCRGILNAQMGREAAGGSRGDKSAQVLPAVSEAG